MQPTAQELLDSKALLTYRDVQVIVGKSGATIKNWVRQGVLPAPTRIGQRAVAWPTDEFKAWMRTRPKATPKAAA